MTNLFDLKDEAVNLDISRYLKAKNKFATGISFGILIIIWSNCFIFLVDSINIFNVILLYILSLIIGVTIIIKTAINYHPYHKIIKGHYYINDDQYDELQKQYSNATKMFIIKLIVGILLIISSIIVSVVLTIITNGYFPISLIFIFIGLGVYLIISSSIKLSSYQSLLSKETK